MNDVVQEMKTQYFFPDVVILNAGAHMRDPFHAFDLDRYQKTFDVNVYGALFWIAAFLPEFSERNTGKFIAISSTSAFRRGCGGVSYGASKAALSLTFRRLRMQFAKTNIGFSTIYFGPIATSLWQGPVLPLLVPSAVRAASYIFSVIGRRSGEYYFPFSTTLLSRLSLLIPEKLFLILHRHLPF